MEPQLYNEQQTGFDANNYEVYCNPFSPQTLVMLKRPQLIVEVLNQRLGMILPNFLFLDQQNAIQQLKMKRFTLIAMLKQQTDKQIMVRQFFKLAHLSYNGIQSNMQIKMLQSNIFSMNSKQILKQYTKDSFFHKIINNLLRVGKDPFQLFYIQYFVKTLFFEIKSIYRQYQSKRQKQKLAFKCYRGAMISQQQLQYIENNKGKCIQCLGFLSASLNESTASMFGSSAIIQISVPNIQRNAEIDNGYCFMQNYSYYKGESQVLFNVLSSFRIVEIVYNERNIIIQLQYGILPQILQKQQKISISSIAIDDRKIVSLAHIYLDNQIYNQGNVLQYDSTKKTYTAMIYYLQMLIQLYQSKMEFTQIEMEQYENALFKICLSYLSLNKYNELQNYLPKLYIQKPNIDQILEKAIVKVGKQDEKSIQKFIKYSFMIANVQLRKFQYQKSIQIVNSALQLIKVFVTQKNKQKFMFRYQWDIELQLFFSLKKIIFLKLKMIDELQKVQEQQKQFIKYSSTKLYNPNNSINLMIKYIKQNKFGIIQMQQQQKQALKHLNFSMKVSNTLNNDQLSEIKNRQRQKLQQFKKLDKYEQGLSFCNKLIETYQQKFVQGFETLLQIYKQIFHLIKFQIIFTCKLFNQKSALKLVKFYSQIFIKNKIAYIDEIEYLKLLGAQLFYLHQTKLNKFIKFCELYVALLEYSKIEKQVIYKYVMNLQIQNLIAKLDDSLIFYLYFKYLIAIGFQIDGLYQQAKIQYEQILQKCVGSEQFYDCLLKDYADLVVKLKAQTQL